MLTTVSKYIVHVRPKYLHNHALGVLDFEFEADLLLLQGSLPISFKIRYFQVRFEWPGETSNERKN